MGIARMKIALFSWEARFGIEIGGVSAHVSDLAAALAALGHEVHLFTRQGPEQSLEDFIFGVRYHRCPAPRSTNFLEEIRAFNRSLEYYFREAARSCGGFDLVHCHDWLTLQAGEAVRNDCRFVVTFHTTEWGRSGSWPEHGQAREIADLEAAATQKADAVIAVSHEVRRQVNLLYRCPDWKLRVIYHGIDLSRFTATEEDAAGVRQTLRIAAGEPVALFVGSLHFRKGPEVLLRAFLDARKKIPAAKLVYAGEGEMLGRLQAEAQSDGSAEAVRFVGWPKAAQLQALYAAADVVCLPYRYDPFGVVALEAWAAGKPVIVSGDGAAAEIVYDKANGLRCSESGLTDALAGLLGEPEMARWMGRNGRVAAETAFSWQAIAEQTLNAYEAKSAIDA